MTPKKPDRWERLINQENTYYVNNTEMMSVKRVVELLRKEHAAVVRMVRSLQKAHSEYMDEWSVLQLILDQLKRRAK